jgi:hypothetical protein
MSYNSSPHLDCNICGGEKQGWGGSLSPILVTLLRSWGNRSRMGGLHPIFHTTPTIEERETEAKRSVYGAMFTHYSAE